MNIHCYSQWARGTVLYWAGIIPPFFQDPRSFLPKIPPLFWNPWTMGRIKKHPLSPWIYRQSCIPISVLSEPPGDHTYTQISDLCPQIADTFLSTQICIKWDPYLRAVSQLIFRYERRYDWFSRNNHWITCCVDTTLLKTYIQTNIPSALKRFTTKVPLLLNLKSKRYHYLRSEPGSEKVPFSEYYVIYEWAPRNINVPIHRLCLKLCHVYVPERTVRGKVFFPQKNQLRKYF